MSTTKNTADENQFDLNGPLSSQNGKNPFHIDDSYFDAFADRLNDTITDLEEINAEAPVLCSIPKYNPFEVPTTYFDQFPAAIQERVTFQQPRFSFKEWLFQILKPNFAFPFVITVLIAYAAIHFIDKQAEQTNTKITADVSLEEQLYTIDENTIVDLLNENDTNPEIKNPADETITNYLIDNNVDENSLSTDFNTPEHENE